MRSRITQNIDYQERLWRGLNSGSKAGPCISRKDLIAEYEARGQPVFKKPLRVSTPTVDDPPEPDPE